MKKDANGIIRGKGALNAPDTAFPDAAQDSLFALEDESWWFVNRAKLILSVAGSFLNPQRLTMDVGGGNGYTTMILKDNGFRMGLMEPSYGACLNARSRGIDPVLCDTVGNRENAFGQAMLLDVLEHIEDDTAFLLQIKKELKPGGRLLLTVPALPILWSSEDDVAGHYRRYTKKTLVKKLEKAGFTVSYCSYFYSWLVMPVLLVRVGMEKAGLLKRTQERSEEEAERIAEQQFKQKSGMINALLHLLTKAEGVLLSKRQNIGIGTSLICLAKLPD